MKIKGKGIPPDALFLFISARFNTALIIQNATDIIMTFEKNNTLFSYKLLI
jgi:hypothetical protein